MARAQDRNLSVLIAVDDGIQELVRMGVITAEWLEIQTWPIDRLVLYVRNPRKNAGMGLAPHRDWRVGRAE
jgi:hypothetical protein